MLARDLRASVDIAAFVSQFTRLRRAGSQLVGLCPIHGERHPSFYVHPQKQVFYCFVCGTGGDVFAFVMRTTGCDFRCAVQVVADFSEGIARTSEPRSGARFGEGVGAKPLSPAKRGAPHSQSLQETRVRILDALEATNRRLRAIEETNRAASAALATAYEPERGGCSLFIKNRITLPGGCDE